MKLLLKIGLLFSIVLVSILQIRSSYAKPFARNNSAKSASAKNISAKNISAKTKASYVRLLPIFFKENSSVIDSTVGNNPQNMPDLLQAIKVKCSSVKLTVQGHCSFTEKDQKKLCKARAENVKKWLIENGVPASRITGVAVIGSKVDLVEEPRDKKERAAMDQKTLKMITAKNYFVDFLMSTPCSEPD